MILNVLASLACLSYKEWQFENEKKKGHYHPYKLESLYKYNAEIAKSLSDSFCKTPEESCLHFRNALERFIDSYGIHNEKSNLLTKINYLQNNGLITKSIAEKCHNIRMLTNKGVHGNKIEINELYRCYDWLVDIILYKWPNSGDNY